MESGPHPLEARVWVPPPSQSPPPTNPLPTPVKPRTTPETISVSDIIGLCSQAEPSGGHILQNVPLPRPPGSHRSRHPSPVLLRTGAQLHWPLQVLGWVGLPELPTPPCSFHRPHGERELEGSQSWELSASPLQTRQDVLTNASSAASSQPVRRAVLKKHNRNHQKHKHPQTLREEKKRPPLSPLWVGSGGGGTTQGQMGQSRAAETSLPEAQDPVARIPGWL